VMAFAKRLLLCALHCTPPVAAGLVFLDSEVCKIRTSLRQDMLCSVEGRPEGEGCKEPASGYTQLGNFDALKRDPLYACTAPPSAWELSLMRLHFHPSVQAFASSFLSADSGHVISYTGDPTVDFSLSSFLNRFSYKNPKKSQVDIRRRRSQAQSEDPVNVLASSGHDGDMAPDKAFFYKFFGDRNRLRAEGKSRNRSRHKKSEDDDEDGSDLGSDFGEDAIDRFADKLADDLMEDNDEDDVPDMDEEMEDEDLG
ncbi:CEBPZ, partial [Symbiodinium microadriaticum]